MLPGRSASKGTGWRRRVWAAAKKLRLLYVELTVMKQSLVRRKNRKLRLLREQYPDIQIKLLYRRDFQRLLAGFGLANAEYEIPRAS